MELGLKNLETSLKKLEILNTLKELGHPIQSIWEIPLKNLETSLKKFEILNTPERVETSH